MLVDGATLQRIYTTGAVPRMVTVACACGGTIRGDRRDPRLYVQAHNRSNRHRDWRLAKENTYGA